MRLALEISVCPMRIFAEEDEPWKSLHKARISGLRERGRMYVFFTPASCSCCSLARFDHRCSEFGSPPVQAALAQPPHGRILQMSVLKPMRGLYRECRRRRRGRLRIGIYTITITITITAMGIKLYVGLQYMPQDANMGAPLNAALIASPSTRLEAIVNCHP